MNPKNNFLNSLKTSFVDPFLKGPAPKSAPMQGPQPLNMSMVPRNDRQANNTYNATQNMSVVPNSTSATSPAPAPITAPKTTPTAPLPPAGKTFVQNQMQPAYDAKTGLLTDYGRSQGLKEVNAPAGGPGNAPGGPISAPEAKKEESPYLTYLRSMFDPEALKKTSENINQLNERTSRELLRTREREDELRANKIGQLKTGQDYQLGEEERLSNRSLADLAIAKGSAQEIYKSMIDAGKSVFEAETAAKKAEQDQANVDKKFGLDERTIKLNEEKAAQDKIDADRRFAEDKRQFGLEYALKKQELDAKTTEVTNAATGKDAEALSSMNLINTLLQNPGLSGITGVPNPFTVLTPGTNAALARNQYNQIKGILALENRGKLKGQGAVSDFEGKTLERAASSLGRNLSDVEFVKQLKQVRGAIATSHGLSADVLLVNPTTKESMIVLSDSAGIAQAIKDGLIVEYQ